MSPICVLLQCVLQCMFKMCSAAHLRVVSICVEVRVEGVECCCSGCCSACYGGAMSPICALFQCVLQCVLRMWDVAHLCVVAVCVAVCVKDVVCCPSVCCCSVC